jgi:hypothetical protein
MLQVFHREATQHVDGAGGAFGSFLSGLVREMPLVFSTLLCDQWTAAFWASAGACRAARHFADEAHFARGTDACK